MRKVLVDRIEKSNGEFIYRAVLKYDANIETSKIFEYFIKDEGWKKIKSIERIAITLPLKKGDIRAIADNYETYGKEVVMKYLINHGPKYRQEAMLQKAIWIKKVLTENNLWYTMPDELLNLIELDVLESVDLI